MVGGLFTRNNIRQEPLEGLYVAGNLLSTSGLSCLFLDPVRNKFVAPSLLAIQLVLSSTSFGIKPNGWYILVRFAGNGPGVNRPI